MFKGKLIGRPTLWFSTEKKVENPLTLSNGVIHLPAKPDLSSSRYKRRSEDKTEKKE